MYNFLTKLSNYSQDLFYGFSWGQSLNNKFIDAVNQKDLSLASYYLNIGANINADYAPYSSFGSKTAAITRAVIEHDINTVKWLLNEGADPNIGNSLKYAVQSGDTALATLLLEHGANPNLEPTLLAKALLRHSPDIAIALIQHGADVNKSWANDFPICIAARHGNAEVVKLLLDKGAKTDLQFEYEMTPQMLKDLHYSSPLYNAIDSKDLNIINLLLDSGKEQLQLSSLHIAVIKGELEQLNELILSQTDIDAADKAGNTPLNYAVIIGFEEGIKTLIEHGANTDGMVKCAILNQNMNSLVTLLDVGCEIQDGLFIAATQFNYKAIDLLLHLGVSLEYKNEEGDTVLTRLEKIIEKLNDYQSLSVLRDKVVEVRDYLINHAAEKQQSAAQENQTDINIDHDTNTTTTHSNKIQALSTITPATDAMENKNPILQIKEVLMDEPVSQKMLAHHNTSMLQIQDVLTDSVKQETITNVNHTDIKPQIGSPYIPSIALENIALTLVHPDGA
ncbi:MAG: ankyrin repeat domain-containing protein [Proteobacteria bacterium]|nr:ankyrin repeat domain-containing protein [Pseudomonadota bacterium]